MIKIIKQILYWSFVAILVLIASITVISATNRSNRIRLYSVVSGSMSPTISMGSLVVVKPENSYQVGDIITYKSEKEKLVKNPKETTTHRIVQLNPTEKGMRYITQGDANNAQDFYPVNKDLVLGKVVFNIPLIGYPIAFARTQTGLIFLIVIPGTLFIFNELMVIKNTIKEELEKRNKFKKITNKRFLSSSLLILILSGTVYSQIQTSNSYFTDRVIVSNSFTTLIPPESSLLLKEGGKEIIFTVRNISLYKKISYELTYDSDSGKQGVLGTASLTGESEFTRTITLGTCTTGGTCTYHTGVMNIHLHVDLEDKDGNITSLDNSL